MSYFLSSLPLWLLIAVIVVIPTAVAMIDHPFTGPVYIHPDALALVLSDYQPAK